MKSPIKMYHLKPVVVRDFVVETPKCMYKLANIHSPKKVDSPVDHVTPPNRNLDIFDQVKQFLKNSQGLPGMAELEARQTDILAQLAQLKQQISSLKKDLNLQNALDIKKTPKKTAVSKNTSTVLPDSLVITVNPTNPPYSLELLQKLLRDAISLTVTSYIHSSVQKLSKEAEQLKEALDSFKPADGVPVVNLRLIWKNISSNAELLLTNTQISGEVNVLRYLSRSINSQLTYESDPDSLELDSLLDQCYLLAQAKTKTEKAGILQALSKTLNKSSWLATREQPSVADLAAYSVIKQRQITNELSATLTNWYQKCASLVVT